MCERCENAANTLPFRMDSEEITSLFATEIVLESFTFVMITGASPKNCARADVSQCGASDALNSASGGEGHFSNSRK